MPDAPSAPVLFQDPLTKEHFYVTRAARELFQAAGHASLAIPSDRQAAFEQAQRLAKSVNKLLEARCGENVKPLLPAQLHGMKVLHAFNHMIVSRFALASNPDMMRRVAQAVSGNMTTGAFQRYMAMFADRFPPGEVFSGKKSVSEFLDSDRNRELAVEESLMVWLNNQNPAFDPFAFLLADSDIQKERGFSVLAEAALRSLKAVGPVCPGNFDPAEFLTLPLRHSPNSILGQLRYIRLHWGDIFEGSALWEMLDQGIGMIEDEDSYLFFEKIGNREKRGHEGWFEKEVRAPEYGDPGDGPENYSADASWMPEVVMLAKSTFVWLDQLSRAYGRPVHRLQDIPDGELDIMAERGFTVLWLIGLWERSPASQKIKQIQGNRDAKASAYALDRYDIAEELGGYEGYLNLRTRAMQRGIRLASDMVPNHTGLDSQLVKENPDWFISAAEPPYPSYTFNGPNLSSDGRYGIYLEDGYWDRSDAAVTFKRVDFQTGDTRYLYHGNDGTTMPWNDTAQLNFLSPEVREGVIQQILHVARMFPVIRFDAAMVLAKRHIQRLWFPLPGHAPGIPSRGAYSMSMEEFNRAMPEEFWREVVDRIHQEAPDTLLLAEAFWMLEGYFVRTLGMHRVYNSAFMHMLKKEDNAGYRYLIKNTLEYDARILKRYVNFMNNPDEDTAVAQFGKGDKYFGVCMVMATVPGLPMFGHGQVEGFGEKYGMEYARPLLDETQDPALVARHEREIFPILKKRYLFAEVRHFRLYDFYSPQGGVNENVLAYTNRQGDEKALVVYNNSYSSADGWIRMSAGFREDGQLRQTSLSEGLALGHADGAFVIFREHVSGLEYIRSVGQLREEGLHVLLGGYQYSVFLDFREVRPSRLYPYDRLCGELQGRGVDSIDTAALEIALGPLHEIVAAFLDEEALMEMIAIDDPGKRLERIGSALGGFLDDAGNAIGRLLDLDCGDAGMLAESAAVSFETARGIVDKLREEGEERGKTLLAGLAPPSAGGADAFGYLSLTRYALGAFSGMLREACPHRDDPVDDWLLDRPLRKVLSGSADRLRLPVTDLTDMFWCMLAAEPALEPPLRPEHYLFLCLSGLLGEHESAHVGRFLSVEHLYGKRWFREERFVRLLSWIALEGLVRSGDAGEVARDVVAEAWSGAVSDILEKAFLSGYEADLFLKSFDVFPENTQGIDGEC